MHQFRSSTSYQSVFPSISTAPLSFRQGSLEILSFSKAKSHHGWYIFKIKDKHLYLFRESRQSQGRLCYQKEPWKINYLVPKKKIYITKQPLIDKKILNIASTKFYNLTTELVFKMKTLFHEGIQKLQIITNIASLSQERFVQAPVDQQASVVQKVDNAIHRINHYQLDNAIGFPS